MTWCASSSPVRVAPTAVAMTRYSPSTPKASSFGPFSDDPRIVDPRGLCIDPVRRADLPEQRGPDVCRPRSQRTRRAQLRADDRPRPGRRRVRARRSLLPHDAAPPDDFRYLCDARQQRGTPPPRKASSHSHAGSATGGWDAFAFSPMQQLPRRDSLAGRVLLVRGCSSLAEPRELAFRAPVDRESQRPSPAGTRRATFDAQTGAVTVQGEGV